MDTPAALLPAGDQPVQPLDLLQRTAAELAAALDVVDAVTAVLRTGRDLLRTNTCGIALLDETGTLLVPQVPHGGDVAGLGVGREVPLDTATPSAEAARTRAPVLLRDRADLVARFGAGQALNTSVLDLGENSWAVYPLVVRGRVLGVLRFGLAREGSLDAREQVVAATLAGQCALAVERARLLEDARRSAHRYRTLAEAGSLDVFTARPGAGITSEMPGWAALTGRESVSGTDWQSDLHPDDLPGVLEGFHASVRDRTAARFRVRVRGTTGWRWIAAVAVPVVADPTDPDSEVVEWVGSLDDVTDRVRARRRTRALNALTAALAAATTYPQVLDAVLHACHEGVGAVRGTLTVDEGPGEVALRVHRMLGDRTRRSGGVPDLTLDDLVAVAGDRGVFPVGRAGIEDLPAGVRRFFHAAADGGETSWAVLPLASRTRWLGTLTLGFVDAEALDAEDHEFFLAFARQVAGALDRMQLLQQQRATADVLADALRPGPLPHVPWLSAHRVAVTSAGVEVGGDWAEIIPLPGSGGADRVAVVLGDVMGRGARAATVMGEVRTQVRTLAHVDPHPAAVLRGLDALAAAGGGEDLVTIFYAVLTRDGHLLAASAGHLPPLTCSGGPQYLDVPPGVPVGVGGDARTEVLDVRLAPGSALVVFSDGLVETRERSLTQGLAEVLEHFRGTAHGDPGEIVPTLVRRMVGEDSDTLVDDDVTVLGLRLR